jgi:hypothetical protein
MVNSDAKFASYVLLLFVLKNCWQLMKIYQIFGKNAIKVYFRCTTGFSFQEYGAGYRETRYDGSSFESIPKMSTA